MLLSDPYVALQLGDQRVQTTIMRSNLNPIWNEDLMLSVPDDYGPIKLVCLAMSTLGQLVRHERNARQRKRVLDRNDPPVENMYPQGGPGLSLLADLGVQANVKVDDDVVITSPTALEKKDIGN